MVPKAQAHPLLGARSAGRRAVRPLAVGAVLTLGVVAVALMRSGAPHATSLLATGRGAAAYLSDTAATTDLDTYFDRLNQGEETSLRAQVAQMLRGTAGKAAPAKKPAAKGKLAAVDRALEKEEHKVGELKEQRAMLERKEGKVQAKQQQLRWRTYPPGGGATSYAKSLKDVDAKDLKSKECLPPKVMIDGKCENYRKLEAEKKAKARQILRKRAYYRYKWSHEWRKHGRKHHYRIVPKRFPHESGADLGDNYVGLDCGKSDCRYKVLSDKMRKDDGKYPHSRIPKLFRAFTGDGMDMRYPLRPQKLKPGIKIADEGSIDKAVGGFFKSQKLGYQRYMEQFHPWDKIVRRPTRTDRFRPLASSLYRKKNYPKGGGASRAHEGWKTPTWSGAVGGKVPSLQAVPPREHALPVVRGPKTDAEKALIGGSDPLKVGALFGDEQMPAADVLQGQARDAYGRKAQGEPLTDASMNNWDMMNGVADP